MKSGITLIFKKAQLQAILTIVSFVLFLVVYLFMTVFSIEPHYLQGLLFAIPFACFGVITFLTVREKLKAFVKITNILLLIFWVVFTALFLFLSFDAATTVTTNTAKYERVLRFTDYPNNELTERFPDKIPGNAKNTVFHYNPAFLQGGETFALQFETDSNSFQNYVNTFSKDAKWSGKATDPAAEKNGILPEQLGINGVQIPDDFMVYVFYREPYQPDNWNHGKVSYAAVNSQQKIVLFYAEDW